MSNLTEFLKRQAQEQRAGAGQREELRREWVESLNELVTRLSGWLRDADPEKVLTVEPREYTLREEKIGAYPAPGLKIGLGTREVNVVPLARFVVGPHLPCGGTHMLGTDGRVDMTDGQLRFRLYRVRDDRGEHWLMVDDQTSSVCMLDRDAFENAVQSMLE